MRYILPADLYKVYNKAFLNDEKKNVLTILYQPIVGSLAINLYLTLYNDLNTNESDSDDLNHQHLMTNMLVKLDSIVEARERLEAIGLLKTYFKEDSINKYLYVLYAPISPNEFLNHPILNVVLYNNVGKIEYERIVDKFRKKHLNVKEYQDITTSFDKVFTSINGYSYTNDDIIQDKTRKIKINSNIDLNLIVSGIPRRMTSEKCFTNDVLDLITNLAYIYKIDNLNMQGLVRNAINEKGLIDDKELRNLCRNYYQFENNGKLPTVIYNRQPDYLKEPLGGNSAIAKMIYTFENTSPYDFLKSSYNNAEPTNRDKRILENLIIDQKLNPGVVNVLIDYVLKSNNKKMNKEFIEAIAGQWKRLNVETVKEAMDICRKEHRKLVKNVKGQNKKVENDSSENIPEWFDNNFDSNKENIEEFNDILKDFK